MQITDEEVSEDILTKFTITPSWTVQNNTEDESREWRMNTCINLIDIFVTNKHLNYWMVNLLTYLVNLLTYLFDS